MAVFLQGAPLLEDPQTQGQEYEQPEEERFLVRQDRFGVRCQVACRDPDLEALERFEPAAEHKRPQDGAQGAPGVQQRG